MRGLRPFLEVTMCAFGISFAALSTLAQTEQKPASRPLPRISTPAQKRPAPMRLQSRLQPGRLHQHPLAANRQRRDCGGRGRRDRHDQSDAHGGPADFSNGV